MPDFSDILQRDEGGNWVYDDGQTQAEFTPWELERILTIEPLTDEVICTVAEGVKAGTIFISDQCPDKLFSAIFMIVMLLDDKKRAEFALRDITLFWEYIQNAGPRAINGYPSFFSCKLMNRDDHMRLREKLIAIGVIDGQPECEPDTGSDRLDGCNMG